jgi:hypothetical protein
MQESESSQRFKALHKAIGKMGWENVAENPASASSEIPRTRPVHADSEPVQWVPADAMHESALKRAQRIARLRAERELVFERARMVETVSRLRLGKIERQVRESQSAVVAMEHRLRSGGHTGRLDWMEKQVARVRGLATQG